MIRIPEFGGAWLEDESDERVLHIWLTEPDDEIAENVVAALRQGSPGEKFNAARVTVHRADYNHKQLQRWALQAMGIPRVTTTGVDHKHNGVRVGVADLEADRPIVSVDLARRGIPTDAVYFVRLSFRLATPAPGTKRGVYGLVLAALGSLSAVAVAICRRRLQRR